MPRASAFTSVGRRLAELARPQRADLHVHTTASDGEFTPSQVAAFARQAGLAAVAVTDHDTVAAVAEAQLAAQSHVEVIAGVEITTGYEGREFHLLGHFVRIDHTALNTALAQLCDRRRERFRSFVATLATRGIVLRADRVSQVECASVSLGQRHIAKLLVEGGFARNRTEAFHRHIGPLRREATPKLLLPIAEAIGLVRDADGVATLAHPPADLTENDYRTLADFGLQGLEVEYPWGRKSPSARLREDAARFGFAITGGSDCHGPDPANRKIGSHGIGLAALEILRERAGCSGSRI